VIVFVAFFVVGGDFVDDAVIDAHEMGGVVMIER